jgi:Flp pilus assembly protein TadB
MVACLRLACLALAAVVFVALTWYALAAGYSIPAAIVGGALGIAWGRAAVAERRQRGR